MRLHDFLFKVSGALSSEHPASLYDYLIHTMENCGGFLRSRWYYDPDTTIDNFNIPAVHLVLVTYHGDVDFDHPTLYETLDSDAYSVQVSLVKLQIFYENYSSDDAMIDAIEWAMQLGYDQYKIIRI